MYGFTSNESAQQRQSDLQRYAVDGGRVAGGSQNSQNNPNQARRSSGGILVQNPVIGSIYPGQTAQSSSNIPMHTNLSTGQRSMLGAQNNGVNYPYIAAASTTTQPQHQSSAFPTQQQQRVSAHSSATEQHHAQQARQQIPLVNWPPPIPSQPSAGSLQQQLVASGSQPRVYSTTAQTQQVQAQTRGPLLTFSNPPGAGPSMQTAVIGGYAIPAPAPAPASAPVSVPAPNSMAQPQSAVPREFHPLMLAESEASLRPLRQALDGIWGNFSLAHTTALAKERDAHIASVRALNSERQTNDKLRNQVQMLMKREQELLAAPKSVSGHTLSEEASRQVRAAVAAAGEEGRKQGRQEGRQERNALQLDYEGVQVELAEQKKVISRLRAETDRLRAALRTTDRLVAFQQHEMTKLLLEIPPTRNQCAPPQSEEDTARMRALFVGVNEVLDGLRDHRAAKQKVADFVQMLNMELLSLVDNWTRRGEDVLLSSRWKKAWTAAAMNGQGSARSARKRVSVAPSLTTTSAPTLARKDSLTAHPTLPAQRRNDSVSTSASPSVASSISRKLSVASTSTSLVTPPPPSPATVPPASGSSHATAIDVDLDDTYEQPSSSFGKSTAKTPSPSTEFRSLLDLIAEARQDFGLPMMSSPPTTASCVNTSASTVASPLTQDYFTFGLSALLMPVSSGAIAVEPSIPEAPRFSPPVDEILPVAQEPTLADRERLGWHVRSLALPSIPASPPAVLQESTEHIPSSPCLLKEVLPLRRVDSPMGVEAPGPSSSIPVNVPFGCENEAGNVGTTCRKRTWAELEEGQDIHGREDSKSARGNVEADRKRHASERSSVPPILAKSEPMDDFLLGGQPSGDEEMDQLESDIGDSPFSMKLELEDDFVLEQDSAPTADSTAPEVPPPPCNTATLSLPLTSPMNDLEEGEITPDVSQNGTPQFQSVASRASAPVSRSSDPSVTSQQKEQRPTSDATGSARPSNDHPMVAGPSHTHRSSSSPSKRLSGAQARSTNRDDSGHNSRAHERRSVSGTLSSQLSSRTVTPNPRHPQPGSPPRPSQLKITKLGISHIDLLYRTSEYYYICRMCETRPRGSDSRALSVARYPRDASWHTLIGHCRKDHPVACEELESKKPSDIAEIRQRLLSSRIGRSSS